MLASKRGVYLPELVLVPKRQPEVQIDLNSSDLQDDIKTIVEEDTVNKMKFYEKMQQNPANNVLKMPDIKNRDITRYKTLYC